MERPIDDARTRPGFARYAWGVLLFNLLVILVGTVVRATGSGAGCGQHWPTCQGEIVPLAFSVHKAIEYTHRFISMLDGLLVLGLFGGVFAFTSKKHPARRAVVVSLALTLVEAWIGRYIVKNELVTTNASVQRAIWMSVHLCNTFFLLTSLTLTAWYVSGANRIKLRGQGTVLGSLALAFLASLMLGVSGAITALGDTLYPATSHDEVIRLANLPGAPFLLKLRIWHPYIAGSVGLYLILIAGLIAHLRPSAPTKRWAGAVGWLFLAQILVGLVNVFLKAPVGMQVFHLMMADLVWVSLVLLSSAAMTEGVLQVENLVFSAGGDAMPASQSLVPPTEPATWRDYILLMKPRVISLLLFTTLTAMFVAAKGWPGLGIFLAVFVGGFCSAGAANAMNMVIDRDIDVRMKRTAKRPTVTAQIPATRALAFSMTLAFISFSVLWLGSNLLAAMLSLCGLVFYVVVYTLFLKRRTAQNIVLGGAAGCFPPLVGWAAVTGDLRGALAWYLFAIIFVWTPAHFWALALMIKDDYREAGVPMLPSVSGEKTTVAQIVVYAVITAFVSLLPAVNRLVGGVYVVTALVLGVLLVQRSVKLCRAWDRPRALSMYKFSMLYLALLFLAMAVDARFRL